MATVAKFSPVTQVILSVVGLIVGTAALYGLRLAVKVGRAVHDAIDKVVAFTGAVTAQTTAQAEINAIAAQLGTQSRRADMKPLEDYVHDFRHDFNNWRTIQEGLVVTLVKALDRTTVVLDGLTQVLDRLTALEEQKAI